MAGLDIVTDIESELLALDLVRQQLRVDLSDTDEDEYIAGLIKAAREAAELHTNRSYGPRTFREYFDGFPELRLPIPYNLTYDIPSRHDLPSAQHNRFELSRSPLGEVAQIQYLDQTGAEQTLDPSLYYVASHRDPARIHRAPNSWWPQMLHRVDSVWVDYTAGYEALPGVAQQGMLLLITHWYENRAPVALSTLKELPFSVTNLLDKNRVYYQA